MPALVAEIERRLDRLSALRGEVARSPRRRWANRARAVHATLAIEGNRLSPGQVTAILDGKRVLASPREVQEVPSCAAACSASAPTRGRGGGRW